MKTIYLIIFSTVFLSFNSWSQLANTNNWYFGSQAGVDFNSGTPVFLLNSSMDAYEGTATISDDNGSLLFYTDGITVYNANHIIMQNGSGLFGEPSSTQAALVVPFPSTPGSYYIFTTGQTCSGPFTYSVVDINLAAGLGVVTIKNNSLLPSVAEKLTAVKAANGTDYWVVVHESSNNLFYAYNITPTGISAPVVSAVGSMVSGTDCQGTMKLNPQGTQLAVILEASFTCELFDFDNATGIISNGRILGPMNSYTFGCEFSPSGHYLYVSEDPIGIAQLHQFDVTLSTTAAINASKTTIGSGNSNFYYGALQNGPDGKIYVARENKDSLGVINFPEVQGLGCNYVDAGVSLSGRMCRLGLSNFITSYFDITTGLNDHDNNDQDFSVFPNPVTEQSKLKFKNDGKEKFIFTLYDITGRMIESISTSENEIFITKSNKSSGTYFFNLINTSGSGIIKGKILFAH